MPDGLCCVGVGIGVEVGVGVGVGVGFELSVVSELLEASFPISSFEVNGEIPYLVIAAKEQP